MKTLIIIILGFLEPYIGPLASPSISEEIVDLKNTVTATQKEISELRTDMELESEKEKKLFEISRNTTVIIGVTCFIGLILIFGYTGGEFPSFVGEIGNSIGKQVGEVGKILNENSLKQMNSNNSTLESHFSTLLNRLDKMESTLTNLINKMASQVARSGDPRTSNSDFFSSWTSKNPD
jgi:uncharacterized protein YqgV (UPF0045/DUF77 family)